METNASGYGWDIALWGYTAYIGNDIDANFIPLSSLNFDDAYKFRLYGLKPETVGIEASEGLNNSINNSDLFFLQFSIMAKAFRNTNVTDMQFYRILNALGRMPFKYLYFGTKEGDTDWGTYFDLQDLPANTALRFEIKDRSVEHDFSEGVKTVTFTVQSYKPFRQIDILTFN